MHGDANANFSAHTGAKGSERAQKCSAPNDTSPGESPGQPLQRPAVQ